MSLVGLGRRGGGERCGSVFKNIWNSGNEEAVDEIGNLGLDYVRF